MSGIDRADLARPDLERLDLGEFVGLDGETSLPRCNGELVFEEPWEGRAFAMAAALADQGVFAWADLQAGLITAIAEHQDVDQPSAAYRYYECWLSTLESLVVERAQIAASEIDARLAVLRSRHQAHDHHDHQHDDVHEPLK